MIAVRIFKNGCGDVYGFEIKNHGKSVVCAAVSILAQNAVNSVERLTDDKFICDYDKSGYMFFEHPDLKEGGVSKEATLLLDSLSLGLYGIRGEYKNEIVITEVNHVKD